MSNTFCILTILCLSWRYIFLVFCKQCHLQRHTCLACLLLTQDLLAVIAIALTPQGLAHPLHWQESVQRCDWLIDPQRPIISGVQLLMVYSTCFRELRVTV